MVWDVPVTLYFCPFFNPEYSTVSISVTFFSGLLIWVHTDQQISFPEIGTKAKDSDTEENIANADDKIQLTDTIFLCLFHLEAVLA